MASIRPDARRAATLGAVCAALAVVVTVFATVPALRRSLAALGHLRWQFAALALVAEFGSMVAMARSQRRLLGVGGSPVPLRTAVGVAFGYTALATSIPVAGAGVGTAFSYRYLRRRGVDTVVVSWALTLSGVSAALSLAFVMVVGAAIPGRPGTFLVGLTGAAVYALPMLSVVCALRFPAVRRFVNRTVALAVGGSRRLFHRPRAEAAHAFEELLQRISSLRATRRQYGLAFLSAVRNWVADCNCLACAIIATGSHVPWRGLLLAYCLAKTGGSIGLTPGGIGVVEVTLTAALVASGMSAGPALTAVLVYRLISFWLVLVAGYVTLALITRRQAPTPEPEPEPSVQTS